MRKASAICLLAACAAPASAASAAANGTAAAWPTASEMDAWGGNDTAKTTWNTTDDEAALGGLATLTGTLTYFADKDCTTVGGGPPGLLSNPLSLKKGCNVISTIPGRGSLFYKFYACSSHFIRLQECGGRKCPRDSIGCEFIVRPYRTGRCLDQGGIYVKMACSP